MAVDTPDRVSRTQMEALGAAFGVTELVDPVALLRALKDAGAATANRPIRLAATSLGMLKSSAAIARSVIGTALGQDADDRPFFADRILDQADGLFSADIDRNDAAWKQH